jgi:hypothetical protein
MSRISGGAYILLLYALINSVYRDNYTFTFITFYLLLLQQSLQCGGVKCQNNEEDKLNYTYVTLMIAEVADTAAISVEITII